MYSIAAFTLLTCCSKPGNFFPPLCLQNTDETSTGKKLKNNNKLNALTYRFFLVAITVFFGGCTCQDALVLEARQEGQGIYTTCQSLCHHFNPRATGSTVLRMRGRNRVSTAPCRTSDTNSRYLHPDPVPEPRRCVTTALLL